MPIETVFWKALSRYSNRCQSKWRTNECCLAFLHSSAECGAFEKRSEWHTSLCSCQCLHTKRYNSSTLDWFCRWPNKFSWSLLSQAATKDVLQSSNASSSEPKYQLNLSLFESDNANTGGTKTKWVEILTNYSIPSDTNPSVIVYEFECHCNEVILIITEGQH